MDVGYVGQLRRPYQNTTDWGPKQGIYLPQFWRLEVRTRVLADSVPGLGGLCWPADSRLSWCPHMAEREKALVSSSCQKGTNPTVRAHPHDLT